MHLTENLEKKSCKNPNLLLEPQCFTAAVVSPSPAVSLQEEWSGWRVTSSEMGFSSQTIAHPHVWNGFIKCHSCSEITAVWQW